MAGVIVERAMERDEIRTLQEFVERDHGCAQLAGGGFVWIGIVGEDVHIESARSFGHLSANPAKSDDPDGGMVDVWPDQERWPPGLPFAGADIIDSFNHAAGRSHQERPREVGGRFGQDAGVLQTMTSVRGGGVDIDIVVADGEVGDHLQLRVCFDNWASIGSVTSEMMPSRPLIRG